MVEFSALILWHKCSKLWDLISVEVQLRPDGAAFESQWGCYVEGIHCVE